MVGHAAVLFWVIVAITMVLTLYVFLYNPERDRIPDVHEH